MPDQRPQKPQRRPGKKPERLKIQIDPQEALQRLLRPQPQAKPPRKKGSEKK